MREVAKRRSKHHKPAQTTDKTKQKRSSTIDARTRLGNAEATPRDRLRTNGTEYPALPLRQHLCTHPPLPARFSTYWPVRQMPAVLPALPRQTLAAPHACPLLRVPACHKVSRFPLLRPRYDMRCRPEGLGGIRPVHVPKAARGTVQIARGVCQCDVATTYVVIWTWPRGSLCFVCE